MSIRWSAAPYVILSSKWILFSTKRIQLSNHAIPDAINTWGPIVVRMGLVHSDTSLIESAGLTRAKIPIHKKGKHTKSGRCSVMSPCYFSRDSTVRPSLRRLKKYGSFRSNGLTSCNCQFVWIAVCRPFWRGSIANISVRARPIFVILLSGRHITTQWDSAPVQYSVQYRCNSSGRNITPGWNLIGYNITTQWYSTPVQYSVSTT